MPQKRAQGKFDLSLILEPNLNLQHRFIRDQKMLPGIVQGLKKRGLRIVLVQGVWDLIHEGHAKFLEVARSHGDILVVGVDSDELTRKRKGPTRPVVPQKERIEMLTHLRHVDLITLREVDDDIGDLIRIVKPHVLVTSSGTQDFTERMKEEYKGVCGDVITLMPQATTTTTARIRNLTIEGAEKLANEVRKLTRDFLKSIQDS